VTSETILYDYWRSSASYRVRIALNLVGESYRSVPIDLVAKAHRAPEHLARNPQGLVPVLDIDGARFTQSLAIVEYLAETRPESGFLPSDFVGRQRVRALSYAIAMDIHPVCNLGVVAHIMEAAQDGQAARRAWMQKFIGEGLAAFERLLDHPSTGSFCHGRRSIMHAAGRSTFPIAPGLPPSMRAAARSTPSRERIPIARSLSSPRIGEPCSVPSSRCREWIGRPEIVTLGFA
jgi:maleylacetoacetate isomerase